MDGSELAVLCQVLKRTHATCSLYSREPASGSGSMMTVEVNDVLISQELKIQHFLMHKGRQLLRCLLLQVAPPAPGRLWTQCAIFRA